MEPYLPLVGYLVALITGIAVALIAANQAVKGYREQKILDRQEDLIRRRQQEYERYLGAFTQAGRWKGVDPIKHAEAEGEYHRAHDNLLLVASDDVVTAANVFHRYYVYTSSPDPKETKLRYAAMVVAMRKDGFEETTLSVKEVAMNIPWTMGNESVRPINWGD